MITSGEQNKIENNEILATTPEKTEEKEISSEEFLEIANTEEQNFKQETTDEISKLNSANVDEPTFEKIKNETSIEQNLNEVNNEASQVINEKSILVKEIKKPETMEELMLKVIDEAEKMEVKPNDKNEKGELLVSPDGRVSNLGKQSELYWKIARTESFKKFFSDWQNNSENSSKILDKNGEPLIVYRFVKRDISLKSFYSKDSYYTPPGTPKGHSPFSLNDYGEGVYFTPHQSYGQNFGGSKFCGFLNVQKPKYSYKEVSFDELAHLDPSYDAVYGKTVTRKPLSYLSNKIIEDLSQIKVVDPNQFLMITNQI